MIAAQLAFSFHAGLLLSGRVRARFPDGVEPAWLRQHGDVVADFGSVIGPVDESGA